MNSGRLNEGVEQHKAPEITLFEEALPSSLFERLARAVRSIGDERLKRNYKTTFWFPLGASPVNVAEEAIVELLRLVNPSSECIGIEWWLGRLAYGKKLNFHFDRDMTLSKKTGQCLQPMHASILYLNSFPSSPTVVLDQIPGPDGTSKIPDKPKFKQSVEAVSNRYMIFPGNLRHGVIPDIDGSKRDNADEKKPVPSEMRLSLLVNYWDRRPLPPICFDYDGTIYTQLKN
jgi:hypothetical protein